MSPLRLAARSLLRSPLHAAVAAGTVALALAAALAVFALSDALFERALPVDEPERLVTFAGAVSEPDVADLAARLASLATLAAFTSTPVALDTGDGPVQLDVDVVTPNYFEVAGARAALGRTFGGDPAADARAAVVAHGAWRSRFAGDPAVVGRTVSVNGAPFTIVGVAAPRFAGVDPEAAPELWLTLDSAPVSMPGWEFRGVREERFLSLVARLAPGATLDVLQVRAAAATATLARDFPKVWGEAKLEAAPAAATAPALREALAPVVRALRFGVGALVAVALANLALLALAREGARTSEGAVRAALGASRAALVAPALAESALVATAGAALALAGAPVLTRVLAALLPGTRRLALDFAVDRRLALAGLAGALLATFAGAAAALVAARGASVAARLARRGATGGGSRLRGALVAAEIALALPLAAAAILFARSLAATGAVDPGFAPNGVLTLRLNAQTVGYPRAEGERALAAALDAVRAVPGVERAGAGFLLPLGFGDIARPVVAAGAPLEPKPDATGYNVVTEGWFGALGLPVVAGRDFADTDRADGAPVVVISRALAARLWPGTRAEDAVGRQVELPNVQEGERGPLHEVVGVVGDVRHVALEAEPAPFFYLPWRQVYRGRLALAVRARPGAEGVTAAVRDAVRRADPKLPTFALQRYDDYLGARLARPRALAALVGTAAALAALLAAVGVAGVVAVAIERRRRELGVRLALGSTPGRAVATAARAGLVPLAWGAAAGVVLAGALARFAAALVYGVEVSSATTSLPGLAAIVLVGGASALLVARRAARLDPSQLLRAE